MGVSGRMKHASQLGGWALVNTYISIAKARRSFVWFQFASLDILSYSKNVLTYVFKSFWHLRGYDHGQCSLKSAQSVLLLICNYNKLYLHFNGCFLPLFCCPLGVNVCPSGISGSWFPLLSRLLFCADWPAGWRDGLETTPPSGLHTEAANCCSEFWNEKEAVKARILEGMATLCRVLWKIFRL